jgi:TetR/AcrR family hemagglutinin/protease transcriptional regulator
MAAKKKAPGVRRARRRLQPEERRDQLVRCALSVFARRGVGRAVHADVARVADVAVSTAFLYFPTREALVDAVLTEVEDFYVVLAEQVHASHDPAPEVVLEHGRRFRASIDSHPDHAYIWLDWSTAVRDDTWPRYLALTERLVSIQERTVRRGQREGSVAPGVDAEAAARLLIGYAQLAAQLKLSDFDEARTQAVGHTVIRAVLSGASTETAA